MSTLDGKIALVTGGSRGIGRAIAERLAHDGAQVVVHYGSNETAAKETVAAIEAVGGKAFALRAELGVPGDVDTVLNGLREHGVDRLDILVNNAAVNSYRTIEELTPAEFDTDFAVNVKAPFFLTQQLLPRLNDGGRIINISSGVARIALPTVISYSATKGALEVFSHTLAKHLGPRGITVNVVRPGYIATEMNAEELSDPATRERARSLSAFGEIGRPAHVADAVAFLASDDSRWVTGTIIDATGGSAL
ncbi:SDR family oxidoreductase [Pseudonocardiaceae bacterium YIM PH 21723]|nr:SDR family oxidoreductase [Pseudonocardiaceae bacterium YIM PH 21723]